MAAATLVATSFHVVPTMAAESGTASPGVQTAVLRATVLSSADATVGAPQVCVHRLVKAAVAPVAPVSAKSPVAAAAPASARAVVFAAPYAPAAAAAVVLQAPQSVPAMAPPSPVGAPASPAVAPAAPMTQPAAELAPATPTTPAVAPVPPAAPADKEKNKRKNSYVYRMGPDGDEVVSINGKVRLLTPEEKEQFEKAMEQFKNGDFAKYMGDLQREMSDLRMTDTFDSRELREKMEAAQRELAQSALVNNADLQAKIQTMMKNFDKQNMFFGNCKDGVVKDKEKAKQKQPESPQNR
jgi:hypothetical protein